MLINSFSHLFFCQYFRFQYQPQVVCGHSITSVCHFPLFKKRCRMKNNTKIVKLLLSYIYSYVSAYFSSFCYILHVCLQCFQILGCMRMSGFCCPAERLDGFSGCPSFT